MMTTRQPPKNMRTKLMNDRDTSFLARPHSSFKAMPFRRLVGGAASSLGPLTLFSGGASSPFLRLYRFASNSARVMRVPKKWLSRRVSVRKLVLGEINSLKVNEVRFWGRQETREKVKSAKAPGHATCGNTHG